MKEELYKNKMIFIAHLDQAMSYMESFYREDLENTRKEMDSRLQGVTDRKKRRKLQRTNDESYQKSVDHIKNFMKANYTFIDMMEQNLSDEKMEYVENICIGIGNIVEMLVSKESSQDINLLLDLYNRGMLNEFLGKVKETIKEKQEDNGDKN